MQHLATASQASGVTIRVTETHGGYSPSDGLCETHGDGARAAATRARKGREGHRAALAPTGVHPSSPSSIASSLPPQGDPRGL
jgi:hypothetical protein